MFLDAPNKELLPFAYNILGSYQDAKDVVQEVILERLQKADVEVENEKAYLVRSVINRAINWKNKHAKNIASYPGTWLPEPVATESADGELHQKEILSYSLLVLMETLDARSRAVFILKEAFDYSHDEIAAALDISAQNSRKILNRARENLKIVERDSVGSNVSSAYLDDYINIIRSGDTKKLEALLHNDIVATSDGGGKAKAARQTLTGREPVLLFLSGIYRKVYRDAVITAVMVNHQPALLYFEEGRLRTCQILELEGEKIINTYLMRNPDKLSALAAIYEPTISKSDIINSQELS